MINFYSCDILVGFLGGIIYILAIKLTLSEQITMIEQVAVQLLYGEHFRGVHNKQDWIVFFFIFKIYNFILVWGRFSNVGGARKSMQRCLKMWVSVLFYNLNQLHETTPKHKVLSRIESRLRYLFSLVWENVRAQKREWSLQADLFSFTKIPNLAGWHDAQNSVTR